MGRLPSALEKAINGFARSSARFGYPLNLQGTCIGESRTASSARQIIDAHFFKLSQTDHICKETLFTALDLLKNAPAIILETGSSAWGTNSSVLFDEYVRNFGGEFATVDIRPIATFALRSKLSPNSRAWCTDSVVFLNNWVSEHPNTKVNLVYLDSWDLDLMDPISSSIHGLREYLAIAPALQPGSLLLIDDTPSSLNFFDRQQDRDRAENFLRLSGLIPGKGSLVQRLLTGRNDVAVVQHEYQILFKFT